MDSKEFFARMSGMYGYNYSSGVVDDELLEPFEGLKRELTNI